MAHSEPDPPDAVPDEITAALEDVSDRQLRTIIHYAQQRLREHPSLTESIESREGEELVRIEDHGQYTLVVVERPDGEAGGPFAYRVRWEPHIEYDGGRYRWHYLGKVGGEGYPT